MSLMKTGGARRDLLETRVRRWTNRATSEASYHHRITWNPGPHTRLIVQKIVRTTKIVGVPELSTYYWELWEVFDAMGQRTVYPYTIEGDRLREGGANAVFYLPGGRGTQAMLKPRVAFTVPATGPDVSFFRFTDPPGAIAYVAPAAPARETLKNDVFTDKATGVGTFKIYGEVYELTLAECRIHRAWLNGFSVFNNLSPHFTAGILPARAGSTFKPRPAPSLTRYEAGRFVGSAGNVSIEEREFPASASRVTYPVGRAGTLVHIAPNEAAPPFAKEVLASARERTRVVVPRAARALDEPPPPGDEGGLAPGLSLTSFPT